MRLLPLLPMLLLVVLGLLPPSLMVLPLALCWCNCSCCICWRICIIDRLRILRTVAVMH